MPTPQQIAAHLDDRFRLLTDGSRTTLPRHRTLRAAIDWSYDLLAEPERKLLQRLAVFVGGFTLDAVADIAGQGEHADPSSSDTQHPKPDTPVDTLDLLTRLVDRSLVVVDPSGPEARYHLLETIRAYALERLDASGRG